MHTTNSFAALALAGTTALFAPPNVMAFNPQPDPPARLGVVSLNPGQTLRLSARVARQVMVSNQDAIPAGCNVSMRFTDGEGRSIGHSVLRLLRQGQASRVDLPGAGMAAEGEMVHPIVRVLPAAQSAQCAVAVTLEVLDQTGRVMVVIDDPNLVTPDSAEQ